MRFSLIWAMTLVLVSAPATAAAAPATAAPAYADWARTSSAVLAQWYDPQRGLYDSTGWWNSANALTAQLDASRELGSSVGAGQAATTYERNAAGGFLNDYYDDEGWWALAWLDAHQLTGDARYLATAKRIFADMTTGWDATCAGGVWWNKRHEYKASIVNELFLAVAAKLGTRTSGAEAAFYLDWATREWAWFSASGLITGSGLVSDRFHDPSCRTVEGTHWSYNQGVVLGGLVDLAQLTGDGGHLATAHRIASAALAGLVDGNGVLRDPCEPSNCGADGPQFKGIFLRNLRALHDADPRPAYRDFIVRNAEAIWTSDRGQGDRLGLVWSGPFDTADAARQSSAQDALNAAAAVAH